jgi:hypothetical protein
MWNTQFILAVIIIIILISLTSSSKTYYNFALRIPSIIICQMSELYNLKRNIVLIHLGDVIGKVNNITTNYKNRNNVFNLQEVLSLLESINRRLTCPDSWLNDSLFKNEVLK